MAATQTAAAIPPTGPTPAGTVQISTSHPIPVPAEGELLVKLEYSGVCHSDIHSIRGDTPMLTDVAGHEGVGRVVSGMYIWHLCIGLFFDWSHTVGTGVGQEWIGTRVGIRYGDIFQLL